VATPSNRIPVRLARGTKAALDSSLSDLNEGELCYANDEDNLYVVEGGVLTRTGQQLDASSARTLLGIGEYVDDAAAGTGGVASGAMYYNTTSSDYRLKS